ncbi:MAG: HIT domain-containing protein [Candidatus Margulisiibacteriota bacterium]
MGECIFCKIASGGVKSDIVYKNEKIVAFRDMSPQAPVHIIIIPVEHIEKVEAVKNYDIFAVIFEAIDAIIKSDTAGVFKDGFRIVANSGRAGGQTVNHLHFHLLAGRQMLWPPG